MPGALTRPSPARAASPERGCTNAAYPSGTAMAMPVGSTARCPGIEDDVLGRDDVGPRVAGKRVRRQRYAGVEALDEHGFHGRQGYPRTS